LHGTINYAFISNVDNCQPRITYENLSAFKTRENRWGNQEWKKPETLATLGKQDTG
jgi:hypothetical protein